MEIMNILCIRTTVKLWICLYQHHESGLFHFLEVPHLRRANVAMEREFSGEVGFFRTHYGKGRVGYYVRVMGDHVLQVRKKHDPAMVQSILDCYSLGAVRKMSAVFEARRKQEQSNLEARRKNLTGLMQMKDKIRSLRPI